MKTTPTEPDLLADVLAERPATPDTLTPLLLAVRGRRRRRQLGPAMAVLAVLVLASFRWFMPTDSTPLTALTEKPTPPLTPPMATRVERVPTVPLAATEWVTTASDAPTVVRAETHSLPGLRATDGELLALAGGRGVGLIRYDGRAELLIADTH